MLLDKKIDDLSENLNPIKIYKISEEDLEQGKKPEFDNFIDIMNIALTRPFESITQLDFKLRKRVDASDLRNKDNLQDLNTKIMD